MLVIMECQKEFDRPCFLEKHMGTHTGEILSNATYAERE